MAPTDIIELSPHQEAAAAEVQRWYENWTPNRPVFVLAGYAGTGKTTVTKTIIDRLGARARYMAYTGKAALVMQQYSGVNATTIHSAIYKLRQVPDSVFERLFARLENQALTDEERSAAQAEIKDLQRPKFELNRKAFRRRGDEEAERDEWEDEAYAEAYAESESERRAEPVDLLVLDECSMVNDEILNDLKSFRVPILALGDPGQLPPVDGTGALFKGLPDARLTEIRRQALDNPIIKWSMWAREKRTLPSTDMDRIQQDKAAKVPWSCFGPAAVFELMMNHHVTLCWTNKTRMRLNTFYRKMQPFAEQDPVLPVPGEKLIITKNDRELGIFNGQFVYVKEVEELFDNYMRVRVLPEGCDGDEGGLTLKLLRAPFEVYHDPEAMSKLRPWDYRDRQQADFGYAITCHKSQGSQWPNVLVVEENALNWPKAYDDRARWLYTAITRAAEKVTILSGRV